ncbi:MAG: D-alanyl-D-alanine carboxypeptidase/D-alanyl-D-alanine-endopeptidase, partial [Gemmatimonadota bacterium]|nr:D-alanyl-D-alanine carboxypeptidase/D-alanyl-D-alanine-endopeptidase [Gemmatimonadota bacterium]
SRRRTAAAAGAVAATRPARWTSPRTADQLEANLGSMLSGRTRSGAWGVMVVSLTRGDTLFALNPDAMLQPASTMKMYTAAIALERLGPNHTFKTSVVRDGSVKDGVLEGTLYLRGDGDPSLSPRYFPGERPMDRLAREVVSAGIRRVRGDLVADASAFEDRLIPEGWQSRYLGAAYAARVSALSLNENLVWVVVTPAGGKAQVQLEPASTTIPVVNSVRVVGGGGGSISAFRASDGSIHVRGAIGRSSGPRRYSLVVDNPPLFTAGALHAALVAAGVTIDGSVRIGETPKDATTVATISSPPLWSIISAMNRESINIFAELLFRSAGRGATDKEGSAQTGLAALREFMSEKVGTRPEVVYAADGSGLSVLDKLTARSMIHLLGYAHRSPWSAQFHASLPVAGESETLRGRMRGTPAQGNLHAKTGTTNSVVSLGGYVTARNGEVVAFSFIYNGGDRWNARAAMDQMGATLAEFARY